MTTPLTQLVLAFIDLFKAELHRSRWRFYTLAWAIALVAAGMAILTIAVGLLLSSIFTALLEVVHVSIAALITGLIAALCALLFFLLASHYLNRP